MYFLFKILILFSYWSQLNFNFINIIYEAKKVYWGGYVNQSKGGKSI